MFLFTLAFIATVTTSVVWPVLPNPWWLVPAGLTFCVALHRRYWAIAGVAAGVAITLCQLHHYVEQKVSMAMTGQDHITVVRPISLPRQTRFGWQFDALMQIEDLSWQGQLRVHWNGITRPPQPGEIWRLCVRVKPPLGWNNGIGFDRLRWLVAADLNGSASVTRCVLPHRVGGTPNLRARLAQALRQLSLSDGAVLATLTVGDRSGLTPAQWQRYQRTGTAHLLAISGLHVGMLYAMALWLCGGWRRHAPWRWAIALMPVAGYVWLAGGATPALRALLMLVLVVGLKVSGRQLGPWRTLMLCAALLVGWDVNLVYGISFWLSFAAVAAIVSAYQLWPDARHWPRWRQMVGLQIWLSLISGLCSVLFFGQASWVAPVANWFLVPVMTVLVLPLALLGVLLLALSWTAGASWILAIANRVVQETGRLLDVVAQWPVVSLPGQTLLATVVMVLLLVAWGVGGRLRHASLLLPLLLWPAGKETPEAWSVHVFDVGQALSVLVESGDAIMLYDVGDAALPGQSAAATVIVPYLMAHGHNRVDQLVISHNDRDHSGGLADLGTLIPVRQAYINHEPWAMPCVRGMQWQVGQVSATVLWPVTRAASGHDNNHSCVIHLTGPGGSVLLMGDLEQTAERALLALAPLPTVDVLVVGHHGSRTATGNALLAAAHPREALISRARLGRYHYPHPDVVARLQQHGVAIHDTGRSGALTVAFDDDGYRVVAQCYEAPRWYQPCEGVE